MRLRTRCRPSFEHLESRWCPALTLVALDAAGNLQIAGTPTSDTITLNFIAQDQIEVVDGATSVGTFNVPGNLRMNLGNKIINNAGSGVVVSLDMNGFGLSGSASLTLGNVINQGGGQAGYAVDDGDLGGTIDGNLSVTAGSGDDSLTLLFGTTIQGNLIFNAGSNTAFGGDVLFIDGGSAIGGSVTATKVNNFTLGITPTPSTVGGNVTLNAAGEGVSNTYIFAGSTTDRSAVGGSVLITTGNGFVDFAIFNGSIGGNLIANLGQGFNNFIVDSTAFVLGNFSYQGGSGIDIVNLASGVGTGAVVMGNISVVAGNGSNVFTMDTGTTIGGSSITYVGGNNVDTLVFNADAAGARLNARLGAGADLFTIGSNNLASAFVDFGTGVDALTLTVPVIGFPVTFLNLP